MIKGVAMGAYTVKNHILHLGGKPVAQRPTPNRGGPLKVDYLVMHYTAALSAAGAISWLCNPAAKASAHLVIAQDGTVTQLAPLNVVCWHAGKSTWAKRSGCNSIHHRRRARKSGSAEQNGLWLRDGDGT
jgi:N-acetylmuramoyl-L-alanine amidase